MRNLLKSALALLLLSTAALGGEAGVSVKKEIRYSTSPPLALDIFSPADISDETPVLVYLFGSGFRRGSAEQAYRIGPAFAEQGVIVVAPDLTFAEPFPAFVQLAAKAVAHTWKAFQTNGATPVRLS